MKIIAVDIDGTLCSEICDDHDAGCQCTNGWKDMDYEKHFQNVVAYPDAITKINTLYDQGHHIVLYTARFLLDKETTLKWLEDNNVKYHKIIMEKFRADLYIDGNAATIKDLNV